MDEQQREQDITERTQAATPGPWVHSIFMICEDTQEDRLAGIALATDYPAGDEEKPSVFHVYSWMQPAPGQAWRNTEFVAHAREDIPWLLAQLAHERQRAARAEAACETAMGYIVRSDWKGADARRALMALESAIPPATPEEAMDQ